MRLKGKVAIVIGAGQSPGEGMGNGRATVLRFAQEGAKVLAVDRDLASAEETVALAAKEGGACVAFEADVTKEKTLAAMIADAQRRCGRIDILHYNVGVEHRRRRRAADRDHRGGVRPRLRHQPARLRHGGASTCCRSCARSSPASILNISSLAACENYPLRHLQGDQGGDDRLHPAGRDPERAIRRPRQLHPAGADGHADGGRHPRPRDRQAARRGGRRRATPRCRCAARWAPPGTSPTRRCFSPPTRPISSPAWRCRSTAARWSRLGEARVCAVAGCRRGHSAPM